MTPKQSAMLLGDKSRSGNCEGEVFGTDVSDFESLIRPYDGYTDLGSIIYPNEASTQMQRDWSVATAKTLALKQHPDFSLGRNQSIDGDGDGKASVRPSFNSTFSHMPHNITNDAFFFHHANPPYWMFARALLEAGRRVICFLRLLFFCCLSSVTKLTFCKCAQKQQAFLDRSSNRIAFVFLQAHVLVELNNGSITPCDRLNTDCERRRAQRTVMAGSKGRHSIDFDLLTTHRLLIVISSRFVQVLQMTCHSSRNYLYFDDGWGCAHKISGPDLEELLKECPRLPRLVVLPACNSFFHGCAILRGGVPFVICCMGTVLDKAVLHFATAFYEIFARGESLQLAFEVARQFVRNCPDLSPKQRISQASKFVLLSRYGLDPSKERLLTTNKTDLPTSNDLRCLMFPGVSAKHFFGRQIEQWKAQVSIKTANLTTLSGSGAYTLACMVCEYLYASRRCHYFDDILWLTCDSTYASSQTYCMHNGPYSDFVGSVGTVLDMLSLTTVNVASFKGEMGGILSEFLACLRSRQTILALDARRLGNDDLYWEKVRCFIDCLVNNTENQRVLLLLPKMGDCVTPEIRLTRGVTQNIELKPLTVHDTLALFAYHLPRNQINHILPTQNIRSPQQLCALLRVALKSPHGKRIWEMIGEGCPSEVCMAAKCMTVETFNELFAIAILGRNLLGMQRK